VPHSTELRQQIEDLALQLVVAEPGDTADAAGWISALHGIRDRALSDHASQLANATTALLESLSASDDQDVLQAGIVRLQQVLDGDTRETSPEAIPSLAQDPELLGDFILESREHLAAVESQLLTLEGDPSVSEALNSVFRGFHTIKGLAGFLELWEVQKVAHETETVLDRARSSQWALRNSPSRSFCSISVISRWMLVEPLPVPPNNISRIGKTREGFNSSTPLPSYGLSPRETMQVGEGSPSRNSA